MITAFYHPGFAAPIGDHEMPIRKFELVAAALRNRGQIRLAEPEPATDADLLRVHTPEYIQAVQTGSPLWLAESQKFPWSSALYPSVCLTNGACIAAGRSALREGVAAALASGFHHSHADHGEGFCTFNGLVVAVEALRSAGKVRTAAILDLDLHYGNGTASLAVTRDYLFALSIYGSDYWNNTAFREVSPRRHADGPNHVSIALPAGCDGGRLETVLSQALPRLIQSTRPDLLFYQAGADPFREDPCSPLALNQSDLKRRDRQVFRFARDHGIPVAWVLAGGYTRDLNKLIEIHVNTAEAALEIFHD